ncbi:MAG: cell wall hydrolase [Clostridia bacterium]
MSIFKKCVITVFFVIFLILGLYITISFDKPDIILKEKLSNILYASDDKILDKNIKKAQSSTSTNKENSGADIAQLLARLINGEARGEPYQGQVAVGAVVLNRVKSPEFPNTIAGVIYQKSQFTCVTDGQFDKPIEKGSTVYQAAKEALSGADPSNGALYFFDPKHTKSKWLFSLKVVTTIGGHRFCLEDKK